MLDVYTDGGLIGRNPSPVGGTWAYVIVEDGQIKWATAGITLALKEPISSNVTELQAVVEAYECVARHSVGHNAVTTLYTDSLVTAQRLRGVGSLANVPQSLVARLNRLMKSRIFARTTVVQISGHPSRAELAAGVAKNGLAVSRWNVLADKLCQQAKKGFDR